MRIEIDHESLRPLIESIITETMERCGKDGERIAYSEVEAAELLGMASHQLRDRRLEGAIKAKKIGKSYFYTRQALKKFVAK